MVATSSSIFIAAPLLLFLGEHRLRRGEARPAAPPATAAGKAAQKAAQKPEAQPQR